MEPAGLAFRASLDGALFMMGLALWLVWKSEKPELQKQKAMRFFALQLFLNFWWSAHFFPFPCAGAGFFGDFIARRDDHGDHFPVRAHFADGSLAARAVPLVGLFCLYFELHDLGDEPMNPPNFSKKKNVRGILPSGRENSKTHAGTNHPPPQIA